MKKKQLGISTKEIKDGLKTCIRVIKLYVSKRNGHDLYVVKMDTGDTKSCPLQKFIHT